MLIGRYYFTRYNKYLQILIAGLIIIILRFALNEICKIVFLVARGLLNSCGSTFWDKRERTKQ